MNGLIEVIRIEKKYDVAEEVAANLKRILSIGLKEDLHNTGGGYRVRSLYFDSIYDGDYMDKLDGLKDRKKIRLRIYNLKKEAVKLEMKEKRGQYQRKRTLSISKEMSKEMIKGNYNQLLGYDNPLAKELYCILQQGVYKPKCIVEYNRYAYIGHENNVRITLDGKIAFSEAKYDLFSERLGLSPVGMNTILEVKYDHFLPYYIKDFLNLADKKEVAFSKYTMARQISYL